MRGADALALNNDETGVMFAFWDMSFSLALVLGRQNANDILLKRSKHFLFVRSCDHGSYFFSKNSSDRKFPLRDCCISPLIHSHPVEPSRERVHP